jgi:ABC-type Fe3+/spermidine/putrescine transport system ATPase subunit
VTHDQREAFALADRIAIMERGRIAQIGTPEDVYRKPGSSSVLRFLGTTNRFTGNLSDNGEVSIAPGLSFAASAGIRAGALLVDIRAEDVTISREPTALHRTSPAQVVLRTFLGSQERIVLKLNDHQVVIDRPAQVALNQEPLAIGAQVYLEFDPASCRLSSAG